MSDPLSSTIARYAYRVHAAIGEGHHVASPLGAWLLLALLAPASSGTRRTAVEDALGCDALRAETLAREVLSTPHPALRLAAATWVRESARTPALTSWLDRVRDVSHVGPVPSQRRADAWAAKKTGGLIRHFPVEIGAATVMVLVNALAAAVSWSQPFATCPASDLALPLAPGFDDVRAMLVDPGSAVAQAIVAGDLGHLAVHAARSADDDLVVVSVVAQPGAAAADVVAAAHPIAIAVATQNPVPGAVDLFDLPLGSGHSWSLDEETVEVRGPDGREQQFTTRMPAWSAASEHDLLAEPALGFRSAGDAVAALLGSHDFDVEAQQSALARYTRTGFKAAAVTSVALRSAAMVAQTHPGLRRTARLEFGHPYAVVAAARGAAPWGGVPVFSAWVAAPDEPVPQ